MIEEFVWRTKEMLAEECSERVGCIEESQRPIMSYVLTNEGHHALDAFALAPYNLIRRIYMFS